MNWHANLLKPSPLGTTNKLPVTALYFSTLFLAFSILFTSFPLSFPTYLLNIYLFNLCFMLISLYFPLLQGTQLRTVSTRQWHWWYTGGDLIRSISMVVLHRSQLVHLTWHLFYPGVLAGFWPLCSTIPPLPNLGLFFVYLSGVATKGIIIVSF